MDLLKKIDELLYNFSIKLGIQNTQEAKIFISEIIIFFGFFFILYTGDKKMISIYFIVFLYCIYDLRKRFKKWICSDNMKFSDYLKKITKMYLDFSNFFHITTAPDGLLLISWIICIPFLLLTIIKHDEKMLLFFSCFLILIVIDSYSHFKKYGIWEKIRKKYSK